MAGLRRLIAILGVALAALSLGLPALAQARIALIVANADYQGTLTSLDNPLNDARAVKAALEAVDFDVKVETDLDEDGFERALRDYRGRLSAAGKDAVGLFYYAGHGAQWQGVNYLIPAGAILRDKGDLPAEAVRMRDLFDALRLAGNATNFVIVDACRTINLKDPYDPTRSNEAGLARPDAPAGVKLFFSAQPGTPAKDGPKGETSPFAAAFADLIGAPGEPEQEVFRQIATRVFDSTNKTQLPWPEGVLTGARAFYFKEAAPSEPRLIRRTRPDGSVEELTTGALSTPAVDGAEIAWSYLKDSTDAAGLERFARENKDHPRAKDALRRAASLTTANRPSSSPPSATTSAPPPVVAAPAPSATASGRRAGEEFRDCSDCPLMVVVPAGSFTMGSPEGEEGHGSDEGPQRTVNIPRAFAVGKFEVTWAEWEACVSGGGCSNSGPDGSGGDEGWGKGSRPVINVNWDDAQAYVGWLSSKTGERYRLLSEAEWEYAARAGTTAPFSFGGTISTDQANYDGNYTYGAGQKGEYRGKTTPVGSFPANPFGLHDMHGNVYEWVEDCYRDSYETAPTDGLAVRGDSPGADECSSLRVLRGGSWLNNPQYLRSADRFGNYPSDRGNIFGFRLARTVSP